jgi:hypothetical protein
MESAVYEKIKQRRNAVCKKQWDQVMKLIESGPQYETPNYSAWDARDIDWSCFKEDEVRKKLESVIEKKVQIVDGYHNIRVYHNLKGDQ